MNSNMLFVGAMAVLAVLIIIASLPFSEKGERVFKKFSLRGWDYYRSMGLYYENISKSEYYRTLKKEAEDRLRDKKLKDKLRNE